VGWALCLSVEPRAYEADPLDSFSRCLSRSPTSKSVTGADARTTELRKRDSCAATAPDAAGNRLCAECNL